MKELNGSELAGFIQERQAKAVRGLKQAHLVQPKLAIVLTVDDPVIEIYMRLKSAYGKEIFTDVEIHRVKQADAISTINALNKDDTVHGIIVQLPLADSSQTDEIINTVDPKKDVDALGKNAIYDPATPTAILWLLAGYGIDLKNKKVALLGKGKLVGAPLEYMFKVSGVDAAAYGASDDIVKATKKADIIISAMGQPGLLTSAMIPQKCVVVDAGVAMESGKAVGDLAADVYERTDLKVTPKRGGVGPLTVCALFENVIKAAKLSASAESDKR